MPLYMDVHRNVEASIEEIIEAHEMDLEVQDNYGVTFRKYWVDEDEGPSSASLKDPTRKLGSWFTRMPMVWSPTRSSRSRSGSDSMARRFEVRIEERRYS